MEERRRNKSIGKIKILQDSVRVAEMYLEIAENDEKAAKVLSDKGFYNQAAYFFIQAMEKQIKHKIANKIDVTNRYFADEIRKTMGHSLEMSIEFLLRIYTGDNIILKQQMENQLMQQVLKQINFQSVHNNVRYPLYSKKYSNYSFLDITRNECWELEDMLKGLKRYLAELDRR